MNLLGPTMPSTMTDEELDRFKPASTAVDSHEYRNEDDEEDYFTATLYKTKEGRPFRYIDSTGMSSSLTADRGEWLSEEEIVNWKEF
jgi:hypothetical protein